MIGNLQVLRGLAALAVVFYHTAYFLPEPFGHTEFQAVPIFFVLSGFIMTYIARSSALEFAINRFTRIVPFYWAITLFSLLWATSGIQNPVYTWPVLGGIIHDQGWGAAFGFLGENLRTGLTPERLHVLTKSLAFIPMSPNEGPTVGVGWSLNLEVFYYLVFACALLLPWKRFAPVAAAAFLADIALANHAPMTKTLASFYNLYFAGGILIFYGWRAADALAFRGRVIVYGVAGAGLVAAHFIAQGGFLGLGPYCELTPFAAVAGALLIHSSGIRASHGALVFLGDISYSLYLTHETTIETCRPVWELWPDLNPSKSALACVAFLALAALVAAAVHVAVERPLIRFSRWAVAKPWSASRVVVLLNPDAAQSASQPSVPAGSG